MTHLFGLRSKQVFFHLPMPGVQPRSWANTKRFSGRKVDGMAGSQPHVRDHGIIIFRPQLHLSFIVSKTFGARIWHNHILLPPSLWQRRRSWGLYGIEKHSLQKHQPFHPSDFPNTSDSQSFSKTTCWRASSIRRRFALTLLVKAPSGCPKFFAVQSLAVWV